MTDAPIPQGYRELNVGEYLQDGDMEFVLHRWEWVPLRTVTNDKYRIRYDKKNTARIPRPIIRKVETLLTGPDMEV